MDDKAKSPSSLRRDDEVARAMIADMFRKRNHRTKRAISNSLQVLFVTAIVSDRVIEVSDGNPEDQVTWRVPRFESVAVEVGDAVLVGNVKGKNRAFLNLTRAAGGETIIGGEFSGNLPNTTTESFDVGSAAESMNFILSDPTDFNKIKKTGWGFVEALMLSSSNLGAAIAAAPEAVQDIIASTLINTSIHEWAYNDTTGQLTLGFSLSEGLSRLATSMQLETLTENVTPYHDLQAPSGTRTFGPGTHGLGVVTQAAKAATANFVYFVPLHFKEAETINLISLNIAGAGAAGTLCRAGIFTGSAPAASAAAGATQTPGVDLGTVSTATTGLKTWAPSYAVTAGSWIWIAFVFSGTPNINYFRSPNGFGASNSDGAPANCRIKTGHGAGAVAFANPETASFTNDEAPAFTFRCA